jgi:phage-related protein
MPYEVEYFNAGVRSRIERWPVGVLADYMRIVALLMEFGPDLGMPHSEAIGGGLFALRAHGREGIGRAVYCFAEGRRVTVLHAFMKKTRTMLPRDLAVARERLKEMRRG